MLCHGGTPHQGMVGICLRGRLYTVRELRNRPIPVNSKSLSELKRKGQLFAFSYLIDMDAFI